jgi:Zinc finger, C3HC4 type (RING finger)
MPLPEERVEEEEGDQQEEDEINDDEDSDSDPGDPFFDGVGDPVLTGSVVQTSATRLRRRTRIRELLRRMATANERRRGRWPIPDAGTIDHLVEASGNPSCLICMEKPRDIAFFSCGHIVSCRACSVNLKNCPFCRQRITERVQVSRSANKVLERSTGDCVHCGKLRDGMHFPCGHVCYCSTCGRLAKRCRICKTKVDYTVNVFWS